MTSMQRPFSASNNKLAYAQSFSRTGVTVRRGGAGAHHPHLHNLAVAYRSRRGQHVAAPLTVQAPPQH